MAQIAVKLKNDLVDNVVMSNPEDYKDDEGWLLVESNPAFLVSEKYLWTVRQSDNKLVHITTGMTPDEENQKSNTELTNLVIAQGTDIEQIKQSITELTNEQLNSKKDTSTTN